jgi:purine nucleosidase
MTRRELAAITASFGFMAQRGSAQQAATRLDPPQQRVDAVLDTDTYNEIDDQFAVAYSIRSSDRINLKAVYAAPFLNERSKSAGEGMQKSYEEILRILDRLKVDAKGFAHTGSKTFMLGADKPVESPAALDLIAKSKGYSAANPLYVITIGAPTNVASALLIDPTLKDRVVLVWMGGQPLDWHTAKEFNLMQDPHSSRLLYDSGVPLIYVPAINASEHLRTTEHEVKYYLQGKSPIASYLSDEFVKYVRANTPKQGFAYSRVIWDISAVAWIVNSKWVDTRVVASPKLTSDLKYDVSDQSRHKIRVSVHCNRDAILNDLFTKLVAG